jgi:hypothetical protein
VNGPRPPLERRYRLLLACYPRAHRAEYGDEMLDVLLADAAGDPADPERRVRRWPAPAAVADLLVGAGRAWLRWGSGRAARSRWAGVAAVLGVALPFAMALTSVPAYVVIALNWSVYLHHWQPFVDPQTFLSGWAVVFALSFTRLRRLTAAAAWLCALAQGGLAALLVLPALPDLAGVASHLCWPALGVLAAAALTLLAAHHRATAPRAGAAGVVRLVGPVGLGVVLVVAVEFVAVQSVVQTIDLGRVLGAVRSTGGPVAWWALVVAGAAAPVLAVALLVRRFGVAMALRVIGVAGGIDLLFQGGGDLPWYVPELVYGPLRWIALPLLAFALPALAARLLDRRAHRPADPGHPTEAARHG